MISFESTIGFELENQKNISDWIEKTIIEEGFKVGELSYLFVSDEELLETNKTFLQHDYYTDIISFDYTLGKLISGEMHLSIDRIKDNAKQFSNSFKDELHRVIIHGILHYCGYKDKTESEQKTMRAKEDYYLSLRPE